MKPNQLPPSAVKLPQMMEDMSSILPYIYLGNYLAATSEAFLRSYNIRHVFSVISEREAIRVEDQVVGIKYKFMNMMDLPGVNMLTFFAESNEYLNNAVESREAVLVHCQLGISRSATIVLAYLMATYRWPFEEALQYLKSHRAIVNPNWGFCYQLKLYERMGYRLDCNNKEFRQFLFNSSVFCKYPEEFHNNLKEYLQLREKLEQTYIATVSEVYHCAQTSCSNAIFTDLNVLQALDCRPVATFGAMLPTTEPCKRYLIEPVSWMLKAATGQYLFADFPQVFSGKITCPHCNAPLGTYTFYQYQLSMCTCIEHRPITSFLSLAIQHDAVVKKSPSKKGLCNSILQLRLDGQVTDVDLL